MCGAIIGALAENIHEQYKHNFNMAKIAFITLKSRMNWNSPESSTVFPTRITLISNFSYYVFALVFLAWNIYFAFADTTVRNPGWDWVQLVVFFVPMLLLQPVRFVFIHDLLKTRPGKPSSA